MIGLFLSLEKDSNKKGKYNNKWLIKNKPWEENSCKKKAKLGYQMTEFHY